MIDVCDVESGETGVSRRYCAPRWKEELEYGMAPSVEPDATPESVLQFARLGELPEHLAGSGT